MEQLPWIKILVISIPITISVTFYFLPSIAAYGRGVCRNPASVLIINLFLGWTIIGWIIALAMGMSGREEKP